MTYLLHLSNGTTYEGFDEREPDDLIAALIESGEDDLPKGWAWIAGLYVRVTDVIAIGGVVRP